MLTDLVAAFSRQRVLVVGDVMLDQYVFGEARRISPEAPVPVVEETFRRSVPGGAANVARNVASAGGRAVLCGVVGADAEGACLVEALAADGVDTSGVVRAEGRPTTSKVRVVAGGQQVVRVDSECRAPLDRAVEGELLGRVAALTEAADVCVLSDYAKGVVSARVARRTILAARCSRRRVLVDPKGADFSRYRGASLVTPNVRELERALGREESGPDDLCRMAADLREALGVPALLVTRGADGMSLFPDGGAALHIPALTRHVYDVTGAGDTVIAILALALAAGADLASAARVANAAAGVVVAEVGTACVRPADLRAALGEEVEAPRRARAAV